ncbi:MAG: hypothetical protein O7C75_03165 [Verrucomicrobia bacterium]|nr:hypothetical protein [Verrucomicrobiota bacterium]
MEINPHRSIRPVQKSQSKSKIGRSPAKIEAVDETSFVGSDLLSAIETGLEALPEVRQERLEIGEQLASDPDYPNKAELEELTKLTLKNLPSEGEDQDES